MTVGGWFDAENLFGALETYKQRRSRQPDGDEHARHGPVGPRRLVAAATATSLGHVSFDAKTAEFYREQIELPFFEYHLKGKGEPQAARGVGLRDRARTTGGSTTPGRRKDAKPRALYLHAGGRLAVETPPTRRPSDGVRRVRQRPGQAGAVSSTRSTSAWRRST